MESTLLGFKNNNLLKQYFKPKTYKWKYGNLSLCKSTSDIFLPKRQEQKVSSHAKYKPI